MPYRKRQYGAQYRRRRFRRPSGVQGMTVGQLAKKAYSGFRMLKGIVNSEKKSADISFPNTQSSTASVTGLTNISQGDDYQNREGRSILLKSVQYNGNIGQHASAITTLFRLVILIDHDNVGTAPTAAEVGITTVNSLRSSNPVATKRFTILQDRLVRLDQGSNRNFPLKGFHKLNHHCKFDGTAATDAVQGSVWLLTVSDQATNVPGVTATSRVRYYDN